MFTVLRLFLFSNLSDSDHRPVELLLVLDFARDLIVVILRHIFGAALHLFLHECLSACKSVVPGLQLAKDCVNSRILHISSKSALHVQLSIFLVQSALKQIIAHALDDFVFKLTDI